jgi:hypothetical protein
MDGTGTALLEPPELPEGELLALPQAAMTRAALPASAVSPTLLVIENNETTSLVGRDVYQDMQQWTGLHGVTAGRNLV